ncbi:transcriptional regulator [Streptomyces sp. NPDC018352]|uniref:transcriptional regulator n=1 Tax=Streptomyces sp. NPDC018352 TaxID=3157194 RepID=UPI0033F1D706
MVTQDGGVADASAREAGGRRPSFSDKLNELFATKKNPDTGNLYTNAEASRALGEAAAGDKRYMLAESTIASLRNGAKPNPTRNTIEALARHFEVKPDFFFPGFDAEEAEKVPAALALIETAKEAEIQGIALRAMGLSADSLKMITTVIDQARRWEGLDKPKE